MKIFLVIILIYATSVLLSGCGIAQEVTQGCGGDMDPLCDALLGNDPDNTKEEELEGRIDSLEIR